MAAFFSKKDKDGKDLNEKAGFLSKSMKDDYVHVPDEHMDGEVQFMGMGSENDGPIDMEVTEDA